MALLIYIKNDDDTFTAVSTSDDLSSPITTVHDGKNGDTRTVCLYLRNDDSAKWYSNIIVRPIDISGDLYEDVSYDETGWGVRVNEGGTEPSPSEWSDIDWGDPIDMDNIGSDSLGDTTTYYPFWYMVTCPPNSDAQNKEDICLRVEYTENAVI